MKAGFICVYAGCCGRNNGTNFAGGAMCWCPITSLGIANCSYEWMLGQFTSSGTRSSSKWTSALSDDLAERSGDSDDSFIACVEDVCAQSHPKHPFNGPWESPRGPLYGRGRVL